MVQFITLYSFLIRKRKTYYVENCLTINNWKQGIYRSVCNGIGNYENNKLHGHGIIGISVDNFVQNVIIKIINVMDHITDGMIMDN